MAKVYRIADFDVNTFLTKKDKKTGETVKRIGFSLGLHRRLTAALLAALEQSKPDVDGVKTLLGTLHAATVVSSRGRTPTACERDQVQRLADVAYQNAKPGDGFTELSRRVLARYNVWVEEDSGRSDLKPISEQYLIKLAGDGAKGTVNFHFQPTLRPRTPKTPGAEGTTTTKGNVTETIA